MSSAASTLPSPHPPAPSAATTRRSTKVRRDPVTIGIVTAITLVLVVLIVLPLVTILSQAFSANGSEVLTSLLRSTTNRTTVINTVVLGLVVGTVGTLIGFFFAYVQARVDIPGKRLLHLICLIPIVSPPFAVATASITLFGRNGIVSIFFLMIRRLSCWASSGTFTDSPA